MNEHLVRPGLDRPRSRGMALRALAAVSNVRERRTLLREATDLLDTGGDHLQFAHALADLSDAHRKFGQTHKARMVACRASQVAEQYHLKPLQGQLVARNAADKVTRDDGEGDDATTLTASERQVAALAAAGHTNREISAKLHVTVSTVEQHLTHAYRKLRVNGRAGLPVSLIRQGS